MIDPVKNFAALCLEHGLTYEELILAVKHLLYWGLGKLVSPIQPNSVYVLTPQGKEALANQELLTSLFPKIPQKSVEAVNLFSRIQSVQQVAVKAQRPL